MDRAETLAQKLTHAARLVGQVQSAMNRKASSCGHCGSKRYEDFDEAKAYDHLGLLAKSLYGQAEALRKGKKR